VIVEPDRLRAELERACADAGLAPASVVAWLVEATRPAGATPVAYLHPAGRVRAGTVLVFRAVGEERAARHAATAHRLAVWRRLPGLPEPALGPMLRHELEHARRWERSGTAFYEADERLRARVGADGYAALPTEREANAAAGGYARRVLAAAELAELAGPAELGELLRAEPPADVVAETLALLGEPVDPGPARLLAAPGRRPGPLVEPVPPAWA
jgi:hypothetical protein